MSTDSIANNETLARHEPPRPPVAVVLLSKDEPSLAESLRVLHPQILAFEGECIVVDASEGRLEYVRAEFPWVHWIDYHKPMGVGVTIPQQRNVGVRASTARVIAFCDAGGIPTEDWLKNLISPIQDGSLSVTCGPVRSQRVSVYKLINDLPDGSVVDTVLTANLAFTREAFDAIGGFDERYEYGSDADFAWRLINAGFPPTSVQRAVMGMDWGDWNLQKKRSWRYGKARARLFRFHPDRRLKILTTSPEVVVYPATIAGTFLSIIAAMLTGWFQLLMFPVAAVATLYARNMKTGKPFGVMADHVIYSVAFIRELWSGAIRIFPGRDKTVLHMPKDTGPYQPYLLDALDAAGVRSGYVPSPTGSKTLNLLLLPATMVVVRIAGVRVIHVHWLHDFSLSWSSGGYANRVVYLWFQLWLRLCKSIGLRLVWTAHNVLPHRAIFRDDVAARVELVRHSDAIITHTETAAQELHTRFGGTVATVIPQGATPPPSARDQRQARERLGWDPERKSLVIVGKVERYKGVVQLLEELRSRVSGGSQDPLHGASLVIAGSCTDTELRNTINAEVEELQHQGVSVTFNEGQLSEQQFWDHLQSSDLALFPFEQITNSGSLVAALSAGVGAVTSDLPAFAEVSTPAVVKAGPTMVQFVDAVTSLIDGDQDVLASMAFEALRWAESRSWDVVARQTRIVYEHILRAEARQ